MKFKNIKKKIYKKKSPSNSRSIPARIKNFKFLFPKLSHIALLKIYHGSLRYFVVCIFIVAVIIVGYDLRGNIQTGQEIASQRKVLTRDLSYWENFITKNKNYPDAYFQAAILEYKLGDISKARDHVRKGLILNPDSKDGKKIEELLNK